MHQHFLCVSADNALCLTATDEPRRKLGENKAVINQQSAGQEKGEKVPVGSYPFSMSLSRTLQSLYFLILPNTKYITKPVFLRLK